MTCVLHDVFMYRGVKYLVHKSGTAVTTYPENTELAQRLSDPGQQYDFSPTTIKHFQDDAETLKQLGRA